MNAQDAVYSLYLHIPFCRHRCSYCDFNTYAGKESMIPAYVQALCAEIEGAARLAGEKQPGGQRPPVHTIFFGGGTPSLLPAADYERFFDAIRRGYRLLPEAEITLEANPGTVSPDYLRDLRSVGFNRISYGMQSANPAELRLLDRQHDTRDVIEAVAWSREAGFDNLNLDLIFGLPEQTLESWQATLEQALAMSPEHLSLYSLTVEHGTPLYKQVTGGLVPEPDADTAADLYEYATERLEDAGFSQYEISNWAKTSLRGELLSCRHNLQYWRNLPYLGFGAGAHGYAGGFRTAVVGGIKTYIDRLAKRAWDGLAFPATPAQSNRTPIDRQTEIQETMMVGLRLTDEGVSARAFQARFGEPLGQVYPREIEELSRWGLLEWAGPDGDRLRLTKRGRLVGNQVFMRFVGEGVEE